MEMRLARAVRTFAIVTSLAATAHTQTDAASAEALFTQGVALLKAGKAAEACAKLEESQRLDPAGGTVVKLGECNEAQGKMATAWARYSEALAAAGSNAERQKAMRDHISRVEAKLARLTVIVPPAIAELEGFEVRRDGIVIGKASWGTALPIDPGRHVIAAIAEGREPWEAKVDMGSGAKQSVTVLQLEKVPVAKPQPTQQSGPVDKARPRPPEESGSSIRTAAYVLGGVGAAGLVLGTYFALKQRSLNGDAQAACSSDRTTCTQAEKDSAESSAADARSAGTIGVVGLVGGGVLLVGGVALFFMSEPPKSAFRVTPVVTASGFALSTGGAW